MFICEPLLKLSSVQKIISDSPSFSSSLCPDQMVGSFSCDGNHGFVFQNSVTTKSAGGFLRQELSSLSPTGFDGSLVLILESPHVDEFDPQTHLPNGPAFGETGANLNRYLMDILHDQQVFDLPQGTYRLILMNAVQYQCSLGEKPPLYRDGIFLSCWEKQEYRQSFCQRLQDVLERFSPCIVINCCTCGTHDQTLTGHKGAPNSVFYQKMGLSPLKRGSDYSLKGRVSAELWESFPQLDFYLLAHPSSWMYGKKNKVVTKAEK